MVSSKYTVRITINLEDHPKMEHIQKNLRKEMYAEGFLTTIEVPASKEVFRLPDGEYNFNGHNVSGNQILEKAKSACARTIKPLFPIRHEEKYSILVTKSISRLWHNLEEDY